ncbi:MAG: plasmid replication protein RepC [Pseudomonadota bacterium]
MERLTTTPFGQRPVSAGLRKAVELVESPAQMPSEAAPEKWQVLNDLGVGRAALGVSDRELGVLDVLLGFLPEQRLGGNASLIVFPSNKALSERLHGMPESTLRRHLSALVNAGLILRHDSPNGKRYAARDFDGEISRAFGFDLTPLRLRAAEIAQAAQAAREAEARYKALRERVVLRKRDAQKLALYGLEEGFPGDWEPLLIALLDCTRRLRRKLSFEELEALSAEVVDLSQQVERTLAKTEDTSADAAHFGCHHQNSNTDTPDFESSSEEENSATDTSLDPSPEEMNIPFALVLKSIPEALSYAQGDIRNPRDIAGLGAFLRGMIGISPSAWDDAVGAMGPETAGLVVCCLVERIEEIRSPGGYLRHLTREQDLGKFSVARLVMANLNRARGKS